VCLRSCPACGWARRSRPLWRHFRIDDVTIASSPLHTPVQKCQATLGPAGAYGVIVVPSLGRRYVHCGHSTPPHHLPESVYEGGLGSLLVTGPA
jgi:hypothetical protein